jgi:hypothetical protein
MTKIICSLKNILFSAEIINEMCYYFDIIKNDIIANKKIIIVTDSEYALRCVTTYGYKCYKKGWNVDIPNKELVKSTYELYKNNKNIKFICVKAHTDIKIILIFIAELKVII